MNHHYEQEQYREEEATTGAHAHSISDPIRHAYLVASALLYVDDD